MNVYQANHVRSEVQIEMKRNYVRLLSQTLHSQIEMMVENLNIKFIFCWTRRQKELQI